MPLAVGQQNHTLPRDSSPLQETRRPFKLRSFPSLSGTRHPSTTPVHFQQASFS